MKKFLLIILSVVLLQNLHSQHKADSASDFTIPDTYGNWYNLHEQFENERVVVLYFFSPQCGNCYIEAAILDSVYQHYGSGTGNVDVWGIADPNSNNADIDSFKNTAGVSFPCLRTAHAEDVFLYYNVYYAPQTIVTCRHMSSGNIAYNDLEFYIEGCFATTEITKTEKLKVAIETHGNSIKIINKSGTPIYSAIYDMTGRQIVKFEVPPRQSRTASNIRNGQIYIIQNISSTGKKETKKIILE